MPFFMAKQQQLFNSSMKTSSRKQEEHVDLQCIHTTKLTNPHSFGTQEKFERQNDCIYQPCHVGCCFFGSV